MRIFCGNPGQLPFKLPIFNPVVKLLVFVQHMRVSNTEQEQSVKLHGRS